MKNLYININTLGLSENEYNMVVKGTQKKRVSHKAGKHHQNGTA